MRDAVASNHQQDSAPDEMMMRNKNDFGSFKYDA
jgi:hypothetical protein